MGFLVFVTLLALACGLALKLCFRKIPPLFPPGPRFTLPVVGQLFYLAPDPIQGMIKLKERLVTKIVRIF